MVLSNYCTHPLWKCQGAECNLQGLFRIHLRTELWSKSKSVETPTELAESRSTTQPTMATQPLQSLLLHENKKSVVVDLHSPQNQLMRARSASRTATQIYDLILIMAIWVF
ncbi:hypothetical protein BD769DRAFT_1391076 [Suillus cothurnatus]|nr:hypothetical protein BD769DRAFT_1391076 [Suillus cothurnatus]